MILKYVCADQSIMNFIAGIEQIAAQLKDTQIMAKILVSLPSSLQYFFAAWDSTPQELKTLSSLTKRLVKEETSQARTKSSKLESDAQDAFLSQKSGSAGKLNTQMGLVHNNMHILPEATSVQEEVNVAEVLFVAEGETIRGEITILTVIGTQHNRSQRN